MFTIQAHGIPPLAAGENGVRLSPAQHRLLTEPKPIRICGAPTGAGKTFAFLQAARQKEQIVVFVVPTQALARDIEAGAARAHVPVHRWDGAQSRELRAGGREPWLERKCQWDGLIQTGGMVVTTPETLSAVILGSPRFKRIPLDLADLLHASHIVFDEAHTLGVRALGFLHFWAVLAVWRHRRDPARAPKLTLLSATHSNLFQALWSADANEESHLPPDAVACFDEQIENGHREDLRMLHGDVEVEIGDGDILACVDRYAAEPLGQGRRLLILYDSLRHLSRDEWALRERLASLGVQPEECFLINGQDRKAGGTSLGGTGFEAGLCPAGKHRVIVATSCIEAGVNIPDLCHAILDPGADAAALLQRIGRVARGDVAGKVWLTAPDDQRQHGLKLKGLAGTHTIDELRQRLEPLRDLPLNHARRLGGAYWSMLKREQRSLYEGLIQAHESLSETRAPGGFLNSLHAMLDGMKGRGQKNGREWLEKVDQELRDLRDFTPEVSIRFADFPIIEYSRDWASAWLERPEHIDDADNEVVWCYRGPRSNYLRDKPRRVTVSVLCPSGDYFPGEFMPGPKALSELQRKYLDSCRRKAKGHPDQEFLSKANDFIEAIGILVRNFTDEGADQDLLVW